MTLPYPHEIETGELAPDRKSSPDPLDLESRLQALVKVDGVNLDIAGRRLRPQTGRQPQREAERVRKALRQRFLERRPNADEATWQRFVESLRAGLSGRETLNADALEGALRLIDGL